MNKIIKLILFSLIIFFSVFFYKIYFNERNLVNESLEINTNVTMEENKNNLIKDTGLKSDHTLDLKIKEEVLSSSSIKNIHGLANKSGIVSVCSIGDPESFSKTLEGININVEKKLVFPDHWPFSLNDVEEINRLSIKEGLKHIVCTEKDFVKLVEFKQHLKVDISAIIINHQLSEELERDILARLA